MDHCIRSSRLCRLLFVVGFGAAGVVMGIRPVQAQELCGGVDYPFPYTDVSGVGAAFCPGIMEAYVTGISKGTTPTTFSPNNTVTRVQMTTFLQRSLDQGLARTSRRAALNQWWAPQNTNAMQSILLGGHPRLCAADGENIWIASPGIVEAVFQVHASTGNVVNLWTIQGSVFGVVVAAGKVFVAGDSTPGGLFVIDPSQAPSGIPLNSVATLGNQPTGIAFDGTNIWTANFGGSVSIITPQSPYTVTTVTTGFNGPTGILYDGAHIWVTDHSAGTLLKLGPTGTVIQTVTVGVGPQFPVFDGVNIWVPNEGDNSISVVQASSGNVIATITADASNQLNNPLAASFDGERILVTNTSGNTVTLFKAADLSFIANVMTGSATNPYGACNDGINFWVTLQNTFGLLRF
jgi:hypothetical protein